MQIQVNTDRHIQGSTEVTGEVEAIVQHALARFGDRITRVEVFLSDENSPQKFGDSDKRCVIEVRLGGLTPITVSHDGSSLDQAVSGAAGRLEKTLKRTLGRKRSMFERSARKRGEMTEATPLLQHDVETGQQQDFIEVLRPLLGSLGSHARRELRIMEANGTLYPGQVIFANLLDEVVTRAWLQFGDRPQWMALDLWLTKILDEILEEHIHPDKRIQTSLYEQLETARPQNVPQVDDQEWWIWLLGEGEGISVGDAVSGRQNAWADEFLEAEELIFRIHTLLGELPKMQRQAFVLNVLETYGLTEIAMLQDRPEADVQADIEAARNYLRDRLRASSSSPETLGREASAVPST